MAKLEKEITRPRAGKRVTFVTSGECRVEQHHKKNCDINAIVARSLPNDEIPMVRAMDVPGVAKDVSWVTDYHTACNIVKSGEEAFMSLDPQTRKEFDNDPGKFLDYVSNPDNREDLIDRGYIDPDPEEPAPIRVEVTNPTSTPEQ